MVRVLVLIFDLYMITFLIVLLLLKQLVRFILKLRSLIEYAISWLLTYETFGAFRIMTEGAPFTDVVATGCYYRILEDLFTYAADTWQSVFIQIALGLLRLDLIVFLFVTDLHSHKFQLFLFLFLLEFLIQKPSRLVIASIVNEYA